MQYARGRRHTIFLVSFKIYFSKKHVKYNICVMCYAMMIENDDGDDDDDYDDGGGGGHDVGERENISKLSVKRNLSLLQSDIH